MTAETIEAKAEQLAGALAALLRRTDLSCEFVPPEEYWAARKALAEWRAVIAEREALNVKGDQQ